MLEVKNLTKQYKPKKGDPVVALDKVSLKLEDKGLVFILGKSGSGKSTLLNVMGGLDAYDSGEIIIKGRSSESFTKSDFDSYRNTFIGFIFQEYNILEEFNIEKNIALALELQGKKPTRENIDTILEEVDLLGYGKRKTTELSGGQKQRVAIARALIKDPEIIFADEPTGALDSATGLQVFETLKKLSKTKLVVVVSHDRDFAESFGDRVIEMIDGRIKEDIIKTTTSPTQVSEGLSVINSELIKIKPGHVLTESDINYITRQLNAPSQEIVISKNPRANKEINNVYRVDEHGNFGTFINTTQNNLDIKNYNPKDLKLIKSKLSLKDSFKMGASALKHKKVRLFFTILLCFISLTMFGLIDAFSTYNESISYSNTLIAQNDKIINISKNQRYYYNNDGSYNTSNLRLTYSDLLNLQEQYNDQTIITQLPKEATNYFSFPLGMELYLNETPAYKVNMANITDFGFTLNGNLPTEKKELMITKLQYLIASKFGTITVSDPDTDTTTKFLPKSEAELLNKWIYYNSRTYKITGIIDTNFSNQSLLDIINNFDTEAQLERETMYNLQDNMRQLENSHHYALYLTDASLAGTDTTSFNNLSNIEIYDGDKKINDLYNFSEYHQDLLRNRQTTKNLTTIPDNQIVLPITWLGLLADIHVSLVFDEVSEEPEARPAEYHITYGTTVKTGEYGTVDQWGNTLSHTPNNFVEDYMSVAAQFLSTNPTFTASIIKDGSTNQKQNTTISIADFYCEAFPEHFLLDYFLNKADHWIDDNNSYRRPEPNTFYSNISTVKKIFEGTDYYSDYGSINSVLITLPTDETALRNMITTLLETDIGDEEYFQVNTNFSYIFDNFRGILSMMAEIFLYFGIGFAALSVLLMTNFISTSVAIKKREIGILRAVGARSTDVVKIFFSESFIISMINFVLALVGTFVIINILNNSIASELGIPLRLLNFGVRQIAIMLGLSITVAAVASALPVSKIARKKPIDAINNR